MARKPISETTQTNIFLKSRRRCCLCFWLKGEDDVKKGQLAHLDGDNENAAEGNLVFLCLEHHDEYDSTPRLSKGLRQGEVKKWRDELYREMTYRFREIKTRSAELSLVRFRWQGPKDEFFATFRVKNTGDVELRNVVVAIRLPDGVRGEIPPPPRPATSDPFGLSARFTTSFNPWGATEELQDLFEPEGRVCVRRSAPLKLLMPGHADDFDALTFRLRALPLGSGLTLEYRIDAEGMPTVRSNLEATVPADVREMDYGPSDY